MDKPPVAPARIIGRLIDAYENGWLDKSEFEPRWRRAKEGLQREQEALVECERDALEEQELRLANSPLSRTK